MFTEEETLYLTRLLQDELQHTEERGIVQGALSKLLCIDDYDVTMHCCSCDEDLHPDFFTGRHQCPRCLRPVCDWCHRHHRDLCEACQAAPPDPMAQYYEAADVLRDLLDG